MTVYSHSGKIGDLLYALPAMRAAGVGTLLLNEKADFPAEAIASLLPLLRAQPYLARVEVRRGEPVDMDLDAFRHQDPDWKNLADRYLDLLRLPAEVRDGAWLTVPERAALPSGTVLIARSLHNHGAAEGFWPAVLSACRERARFVGTEEEHRAFVAEFGEVPFHPTSDLLELAQAIAGAALFVGNQSAPFAIAEGLKVPALQETHPGSPNCLFLRPDALSVRLPDEAALVEPWIRKVLAGEAVDSRSSLPPVPPKRAMLPVCMVVHDDHWFLRATLRSYAAVGPASVFVSRRAWNGREGRWDLCASEAAAMGAEVVVGDWPDESAHRRAALEAMRRKGYRHVLVPDSDEIVSPELLETLVRLAQADVAEVVRVSMETYWKSVRYAVRPSERIRPVLMVDCQRAEHLHVREYAGPRELVLGPDHGLLHHLSYAGPDERILAKIRSWGHRDEVVPQWYERVWLGWDGDRAMRDLHPTHPEAYGFVERIEPPEILAGVWDERPVAGDPEPVNPWPKVSVVIPLHGGVDDIRTCLESLERIQDLLHETIVVDDVSPDEAPRVAAAFPFVTLLTNERNLGFAGTCNRGCEASTGDVVVFLNSDTAVPRAGLVRLVESLLCGDEVGAAGPMTNFSAYHQPTFATYSSLSGLNGFAQDFAWRDASDEDVPMLVGFCLAVRRAVLEEVGLFDERFGRGTFEDNDLCYRILRAGHRLRLAARAYVHHTGHRTLNRIPEPMRELMERNERLFREKWTSDLECGFAANLSGLVGPPVAFDPDRHPDRLRSERARLREEADVSLCMIVRNEERVLGDCLASVMNVFRQVIVVDTGSTDRTKEIALEHGAELYEFPWTESFAEARNESLKYARGRWLMWMDADDTLPAHSAEAILSAAVHAPDEVVGFVIPVRFTDGGASGGTQVDHVKLFRNVPGVSFEGRIHEQVLQSLRPHGEIARLEGAVVLHSGYDVSEEGQAGKRKRDARLLELDLAERPGHPFVLFNLGMTAHYNGEHEDAVDWMRKSIAAAGPGESHVRKAYALMGVSLRELGRPLDALAAYDEGLAAVGTDPELHFQAALVLTSLGRLEEARARYLAMPLDVGGHFTSIDVAILGPKRAHNLASVCASLDRYAEAKGYFQEAIRHGFAPSTLALFEMAAERGDLPTADAALDAFAAMEGRNGAWASGRARLAELRGEDAVRELGALSGERPEDSQVRLALARRLLQEGRLAEALPLLEALDHEGIAEAAFYRSVAAIREGDFLEGIVHARRALHLDPGNEGNLRQVEALHRGLASEREGKEHLLSGPNAGTLGVGEIPLSVVVVTFNSRDLIAACADAALAQMGPEDELFFVDNASADGTPDALWSLAGRDARVRVVLNEENLGYARAANMGIRASRGEELLLINPDVVLGAGALREMRAAVEAGVGAVGPVSDCVGGDQFVGFHLPSGLRPAREELPETLLRLHAGKWRETRLLMGLCLLLSRETLDARGLLDEGCELGADDLELSWRLRRWGLQLRVAPGALAFHVGGASFGTLPSPERLARIARSDASLARKLREFYAPGPVPISHAIWGCDVFEEAFARE